MLALAAHLIKVILCWFFGNEILLSFLLCNVAQLKTTLYPLPFKVRNFSGN